MAEPCVFCDIVRRLAQASIVFEDEKTLAFIDLRQANAGHVLVIPKAHFHDVRELDADTASALMQSVALVTRAVGRAFPNNGISLWHSIGEAAFQEVPHLHIHVHPRLDDDNILRVYESLPENVDLATREEYARRVRRELEGDASPPVPLSAALPGTWELLSRLDVDDAGETVEEPSLGPDPVALLVYDRAGHFSAQFMKRDRAAGAIFDTPTAGSNNTRAQGGYDAYFGDYRVDDVAGTVTQRLRGALSAESVGLEITRGMQVEGDRLIIKLRTTSAAGAPVTRTLTWRRVG